MPGTQALANLRKDSSPKKKFNMLGALIFIKNTMIFFLLCFFKN